MNIEDTFLLTQFQKIFNTKDTLNEKKRLYELKRYKNETLPRKFGSDLQEGVIYRGLEFLLNM